MEHKKVKTLLDKVTKTIQNSEHRGVKVHGITCSRADLEVIQMYCEMLLKNGNINCFMAPRGNVKEVIEKAGIVLKM